MTDIAQSSFVALWSVTPNGKHKPLVGGTKFASRAEKKTEASLSWPTGQGKMPVSRDESHHTRCVGQPCTSRTMIET
jgi:hypothetical protein